MSLDLFLPVVRDWFLGRFAGPTEPQSQGWPSIARGEHTLIAAPTGSGKTLTAFLAAIDRLLREGLERGLPEELRVVYLSPLRALSNDMHRNLEVPLAEISQVAAAQGLDLPPLRIGLRTGDTPARERARLIRQPPHILVTTPESLYLLLTSPRGRERLATVETVIVDEIHALVRDKRGSHLALSLERLDALCQRRVQRIGLSATQRPMERIAAFLVGGDEHHIHPDTQPFPTGPDSSHSPSPQLALPAALAPTAPPVERGLLSRVMATSSAGGTALTAVTAPPLARDTAPADLSRGDGGKFIAAEGDAGSDDDWEELKEEFEDEELEETSDEPLRGATNRPATGALGRPLGEARAEKQSAGEELAQEELSQEELLQEEPPEEEPRRDGPRCRIVDVGHQRELDLNVEIPASDLGAVCMHEQWAEIHARLCELINSHRSTLIFVNTRRMAERITYQLTQLLGEEAVGSHHGSLAANLRHDTEQRLKNGQLKAVVATASLELGLDIGYIDLVIQIGSPRSIATFLQRVGRSGHALGLVPKGRLVALTRDELLECLALIRAIRAGRLDVIPIPAAPLDILAQQVVAEVGCQEWPTEELFALCRRAWPYRRLTRRDFDDTLQYLSEGVAPGSGRGRVFLHWDRVGGRVRGRKGARLTAATNGGAIPEIASYRVVAEPDQTVVGTLDEDFASESTAGEIFLLGNTSWRIVHVRGNDVTVVDAGGAPPSIPFWRGEAPGRTLELSQEVSRLREELERRVDQPEAASQWLQGETGVGAVATDQVVLYARAQKAAIGLLPSHKRIVFERFFDESGGMQLVIHAPFGARIAKAWGLAMRKRFCRSFDFELQATADDDGLILSLGPQHSFPLESMFRMLNARNVDKLLEQALLYVPTFPTRWRWNVTRALLVSRFRNGRKVPPALQRFRADDLLTAVFPKLTGCQENITGDHVLPDHPLVRQSMHDSLQEAHDLEGLREVLGQIDRGEIELIARDTREPSPFCYELLNANPYAFLDGGEVAERRTRAVATRRSLTVESVSDLGRLDPLAIERVGAEAQPQVRSADELHDLLLSRVMIPAAGELGPCRLPGDWLPLFEELVRAGRATRYERLGAGVCWVATERLPVVRGAFPEGTPRPNVRIPSGIALECEPSEARVAMIRGLLEVCGPVTATEVAAYLSLPESSTLASLESLEGEGVVLRGRFRPRPPRSTEPAGNEPAQSEPVQGEPVQGEPAQGEPVGKEPVGKEPVAKEADGIGANDTGANGTGANGTGAGGVHSPGSVSPQAVATSAARKQSPPAHGEVGDTHATGSAGAHAECADAQGGEGACGEDHCGDGHHEPVPRVETPPDIEWCHRRLLSRIHRLTMEGLRRQIEPVPVEVFVRFLTRHQGLWRGTHRQGPAGVFEALSQLQGLDLPAVAWERDLFPPRVENYRPEWLDELCLAGEAGWGRLHPPKRTGDGVRPIASLTRAVPLSLFLRDDLAWLQPEPPQGEPAGLSLPAKEIWNLLQTQGPSFAGDLLVETRMLPTQLTDVLGELAAAGAVTADGFAGLRALVNPPPSSREQPVASAGVTRRRAPLAGAGRWSLWRQRAAGATGTATPSGGAGVAGPQAGTPVGTATATGATGSGAVGATGTGGVKSAGGTRGVDSRVTESRGPAARDGGNTDGVTAWAWQLLRRWGVVFRDLLEREPGAPRWFELLQVFRRLEARGEIRGGRFILGVAGEQFALGETIRLLRQLRDEGPARELVVISAADPLNLVGIVTPHDRVPATASNRVALLDGVPIAAWIAREVRWLVEATDAHQALLRHGNVFAQVGTIEPASVPPGETAGGAAPGNGGGSTAAASGGAEGAGAATGGGPADPLTPQEQQSLRKLQRRLERKQQQQLFPPNRIPRPRW